MELWSFEPGDTDKALLGHVITIGFFLGFFLYNNFLLLFFCYILERKKKASTKIKMWLDFFHNFNHVSHLSSYN